MRPHPANAKVKNVLEVVKIPLVAWVAQQDRARPKSIENIEVFGIAKRESYRSMIKAIVSKNYRLALRHASQINYEIVRVGNVTGKFVVAHDNSKTGQHPTIVVNLDPRLNVVAAAPHAAFETGTAEQAALFVSIGGARAAIISGAHRCASRVFVNCDGKTRVCGNREPYRTSDVAHNPNTLFHAAHIVLDLTWPSSVFLSLHGMRSDNVGIMTSIIISYGYKRDDINQSSPATKLRYSLAKRFGSNGEVVSCDLPGDRKYEARKLCGYTNIQGRYINGDSDVCKVSQTTGTNRFIHIEQDWKILRPFDRSWGKVRNDSVISRFIDAAIEVLPPINQ